MKRHENVMTFRHHVEEIHYCSRGFDQYVIDEFHMQCLQDYRIAAAYLVGMLSIFGTKSGVEDGIDFDKISEAAKAIAAKCEEILKDESIFVMDDKKNHELSKQLKEAVDKADSIISRAGSFCNNQLPLMLRTSEKYLQFVLRARDLCDQATRRFSFS